MFEQRIKADIKVKQNHKNCNYSNKSKVIAGRHWKMRKSTKIHDPNSTVTPVTMQVKEEEKEQTITNQSTEQR